jgi:MFS family permease
MIVSQPALFGRLRNGDIAMVRALRSANVRFYFTGQCLSLMGTWMQQIALSWLVYRLTESAFLLGLINFTLQIPTLLLTPFGGVLADRLNRHRLLVATQLAAMVQAFALAALVLSGHAAYAPLVGLTLLLGLINALDMPVRQAFMVDLIDSKEDLPNAIALNSSLFNAARLIGPSVGGWLIVQVGEGMCFLLNGVSYLAVIGALLAIRVPKVPRLQAPPAVWAGLAEGFRYAYGHPRIRPLLSLIALSSLMALPYTVLLPIVAHRHGGAAILGWMMAAAGAGSLTGAIWLASQKRGRLRWVFTGCALMTISLFAFALTPAFWPAMALLYLVGLGWIVQMASCNMLIQSWVSDDKRGRVMSLYSMAFIGVSPLGALLFGALAARYGVAATLMLGSSVTLIGALAIGFCLRKAADPET